MKKYIAPITAHGYFLLTILGVLLFLFSNSSIGLDLLMLAGCHSVFYPFLGILQAESRGFIIFCLAFWGIYVIAFLVCYIIAAIKRMYFPFAVIALIDVMFSALITLRALGSPAGFSDTHIKMLTGIMFSMFTCICLVRESIYLQKPTTKPLDKLP